MAYWRSNKVSVDSLDELKWEASGEDHSSSTKSTRSPEGPQDPTKPIIVPEIKKRPTWLISTLEEEEGHATPDGTSREVKKPKIFSNYTTLMI